MLKAVKKNGNIIINFAGHVKFYTSDKLTSSVRQNINGEIGLGSIPKYQNYNRIKHTHNTMRNQDFAKGGLENCKFL